MPSSEQNPEKLPEGSGIEAKRRYNEQPELQMNKETDDESPTKK